MRGIPGTVTDPNFGRGSTGIEAAIRREEKRHDERVTIHPEFGVVEATVTVRVRVTSESHAAALLKLSVLARNFAEADTSRTVELRGFDLQLED